MNKKKKKRKMIILTIVIVIILIMAITLFVYSNRSLKYKTEVTIKVGEKIPTISSYVSKSELKRISNKNIKWKNITIKDNKVYSTGSYKGYLKFKGKDILLKLNVIDDQKPSIEGVKDITINEGEDIDLLKEIVVKDNSNDKVSVKVEGTYDTNKSGEYSLSYIATDKSGNKETREFKLIVKEKKKAGSNTSTTTTENVTIGKTTKGYTIKRINGIYYVNDILIANKTYALPKDYAPGGLLSDFNDAFEIMRKDAASEGINLRVISGYRSYSTQNAIYNRYVNRDGVATADTYSARAGYSEHQSGLAADINSLEQTFINTPEGKWLSENCYKYGFIIRYPHNKELLTGYMYEPWHIRYIGKDIAKKLYNNGTWISLEEYLGITSKYS